LSCEVVAIIPRPVEGSHGGASAEVVVGVVGSGVDAACFVVVDEGEDLSCKVVGVVGIRTVTVGFFQQTTEIIVVVIDDLVRPHEIDKNVSDSKNY
jgi:hypothetical protein